MILLASQSPARARLLSAGGIPFHVVRSTCDETLIEHPNPRVLAVERARAKAQGVVHPLPGSSPWVVLAADTVTVLGNILIGKPRDTEHAVEILTMLQGTVHTVVTGHCCLLFDQAGTAIGEAVGVALAKVAMRRMTPPEVRAYVVTGEGALCSGGYAIQETADRFIGEVEGSRDTVIGLHLETVARLYRELTDKPLPGHQSLSGAARILP